VLRPEEPYRGGKRLKRRRHGGADSIGASGRRQSELLGAFTILAVWGVYYLFKYWGGLEPGLGVGQ